MNNEYKELHDEIRRQMIIFENSDSEEDETSWEDWAEVFYHLLVRTLNIIEIKEGIE